MCVHKSSTQISALWQAVRELSLSRCYQQGSAVCSAFLVSCYVIATNSYWSTQSSITFLWKYIVYSEIYNKVTIIMQMKSDFIIFKFLIRRIQACLLLWRHNVSKQALPTFCLALAEIHCTSLSAGRRFYFAYIRTKCMYVCVNVHICELYPFLQRMSQRLPSFADVLMYVCMYEDVRMFILFWKRRTMTIGFRCPFVHMYVCIACNGHVYVYVIWFKMQLQLNIVIAIWIFV